MGLGKTIQALAFLCHLAEAKGMWGPFLVVSPASTLPNWADELKRFAPQLKLLPYWGESAQRAVLRKRLGDPRRLGRRDAPFHILVTSYQLLVADEKHFRRVKWQYMVLDEAQALKSAASARWRTLLGFACRNRLLLTGTPVQNTMAELWALLHFIMPQLFDSHAQFAEWFSKGVEGAAQGDGAALSGHQLSRLHAILKPFMLRRVKADVVQEMAPKTEVLLRCALSPRQRALYAAVRGTLSVAELIAGGVTERKAAGLMNAVMQLRKVCNHPELFERRPPRAPFRFAPPPPTKPILLTAGLGGGGAGGVGPPPGSGAPPPERIRSPHHASAELFLRLPKLLFRDGMDCGGYAAPPPGGGAPRELRALLLHAPASPLTVWSAVHIAGALRDHAEQNTACSVSGSAAAPLPCAWSFTRLIDAAPSHAASLGRAACCPLTRWSLAVVEEAARAASGRDDAAALARARRRPAAATPPSFARRARLVCRLLLLPPCRAAAASAAAAAAAACRPAASASPPPPPLLTPISTRYADHAAVLRAVRGCPSRPATAPPLSLLVSDASFEASAAPSLRAVADAGAWLATSGSPASLGWLPRSCAALASSAARAAPRPFRPLVSPLRDALGGDTEQVLESYSLSSALADSGKLRALDVLLKERFAGGHKVLIFSQMTKMLNLLEEYCVYRKWRHLRLDGSTAIADRREMVASFQKPGSDVFLFLLSTRAGGLGINLTAADSVVFYESDWNPTMDAQAMDRAHRLGQTRPVTVYRLVCAGTIEERIVKRAAQKQAVQSLVMQEGSPLGDASGDVFAPDEVASLLLDDAELEQQMAAKAAAAAANPIGRFGARRPPGKRPAIRVDADGENVQLVEEDEPGGGAGAGAGVAAAQNPFRPPPPPPRPKPAAPPAAKAAAPKPGGVVVGGVGGGGGGGAAKRPKVAPQAASGCSRCRWSASGCKACRPAQQPPAAVAAAQPLGAHAARGAGAAAAAPPPAPAPSPHAPLPAAAPTPRAYGPAVVPSGAAAFRTEAVALLPAPKQAAKHTSRLLAPRPPAPAPHPPPAAAARPPAAAPGGGGGGAAPPAVGGPTAAAPVVRSGLFKVKLKIPQDPSAVPPPPPPPPPPPASAG